jgi:hypothetical protein
MGRGFLGGKSMYGVRMAVSELRHICCGGLLFGVFDVAKLRCDVSRDSYAWMGYTKVALCQRNVLTRLTSKKDTG